MKRKIAAAFKAVGLCTQYGDGWINIRNSQGTHCEFYGDFYEDGTAYFTASYTVDGRNRDLDYWLPADLQDFVDTVSKLLKPSKKRGAS